MLARCPSCGGQVDEDADVCPLCGWDFVQRKRLPGYPKEGAPKPPADKPPEAPKPPPKASAPAPELGRGLKQFPKMEPGAGKKPGPLKPGESPFAIPEATRPKAEPPPEYEVTKDALKKESKPAEKPADKPAPAAAKLPPAKKIEQAPLAAELEEPPAPELPRTVVRKVDTGAVRPPKTIPPKKKPEGAARPQPMGVYIGLASAAVLVISGVGMYVLTRSGEPASRRKAPHPFAQGGSGAVSPLPPVVEPAPPPPKPVEPPPAPKPAPVVEPAPPPPKPVEPPPAPKPAAGPAWSFEGNVFDLINLKPVSGAKMVFYSRGKEFETLTDRRGHYKVAVEPAVSGSYSLSVSQKKYLDGYVDETSPPLAELEANERRGIAVSNAKNDPWVGDLKKTVRRDCYLIPSNLAESPQ